VCAVGATPSSCERRVSRRLLLLPPIAYSEPRSSGEAATRDPSDAHGDESAPTGVRPGCLIGGAAFVLGLVLVVLAVSFVGRGDGRVALGTIEEVAPGTPVYFATDHVFVVKGVDGEILVLSDLDPHNPPGRRSCRVTFRPDLQTSDGGVFFDACTGATYNLAGVGFQDDGLDLMTIEASINQDGQITIRPGDAASRTPVRMQRGAAL